MVFRKMYEEIKQVSKFQYKFIRKNFCKKLWCESKVPIDHQAVPKTIRVDDTDVVC